MNIISLIDENISSIGDYYNLSKKLYEEIIIYLNSYKTFTLLYYQKITSLHKEFENKLNSLKDKSDNNIYNEHLFEYINLFPNIIKKQLANYSPLFNIIELFIKDFGELMNQKINLIKSQQEQYDESKRAFLSKYQETENIKSACFNNFSITEDTIIQFYTQKKSDKEDVIYDNKQDNEKLNSEKLKKLEDKLNNLIKETKTMEKNYLNHIESSKLIKQKVIENSEKTANIIHLGLNDISSKYQNDIINIISMVKMCFQEPLSILNTYLNKICKVNTKNELDELYLNFTNKNVTSSNIFPSKYKLKTIGLINNSNNENIFSMEMFDKDDDNEENIYFEKEEISEINLLVIKKMYNSFSLLSANKLDIKSEEEKVQTRKLSNKLFLNIKEYNNNSRKVNVSPNKVFSIKDSEDLEKLIHKNLNKYIFLQRLTRFRSLKYDLSLKFFVIIGKLLNNILSNVEQNNDIFTAKNCIILSQTFYYEYQNDKIYLKAYIQNNNLFKSKKFWDELLDCLINDNAKKSISNIKENAFGNIYTVINNMFEFGLNGNEIKEIVEPKIKKYELDNNYVKDINELIKINMENNSYIEEINKYNKNIKEILEKYDKEINEETIENENKEKKDKKEKKDWDIDNYTGGKPHSKSIAFNKINKSMFKKAPTQINKSKKQSIWDLDEN